MADRDIAGAVVNTGEYAAFVNVKEITTPPADGHLQSVVVSGRKVTILNVAGVLHCMDTICYHAGGPLFGVKDTVDIEEIAGHQCVFCPWHRYAIEVSTGDGIYNSFDIETKTTKWKSKGQRQRVHKVEQRPDGIYVALSIGGQVPSDQYASYVAGYTPSETPEVKPRARPQDKVSFFPKPTGPGKSM